MGNGQENGFLAPVKEIIRLCTKDYLTSIFWSLMGYVLGYLNFSFVWIIHLALLLALKKLDYKSHSWFISSCSRKSALFDVSRKSSTFGEKAVLQNLVTENLKGDSEEDGKSDFPKIDVSGIPLFEALPSWAIYPDLERAEWLNIIVSKLWPNIARSIENKIKVILHKKIKFILEARCPKSVADSFDIRTFYIGGYPPRITGIKIHETNIKKKEDSEQNNMKRQGFNPSRTHGISKASMTKDEQSNKNAYANFEQDEIMIDFNIVYPSDCEIKVDMIGVTGKIGNFKLCGDLRVILYLPSVSESLEEFSPPFLSGMKAYFLSDPTIDVELGSTINAMLHSTGYRNDFHCAISEVMSSFKFIRSFKKDKETISRKKSRIKRRSTSKGFFDIRSESVSSSKSNQSLFAEHQSFEENEALKENEVSSVLGDISCMMLNLSGISQNSPVLHNEISDTSSTKTKRESVLTNTSEDTYVLSSGVSYNTNEDTCGDSHEAEVKLTISYNSNKKRLKIKLHEAKDLPRDEDFARDDKEDQNDSLPNTSISIYVTEKYTNRPKSSQDASSSNFWNRRPEINSSSIQNNTTCPVFNETFYFNEIESDNFNNLGIEIVVDDKKCLINDTMGQTLIRLHHLQLLNNDEVTGWFKLQNAIDLKQVNLSEVDSE